MKLKFIIPIIEAKAIYFQDMKENYITDTSDNMCYNYVSPESIVIKIEPFNDNDILITIDKQ